MPVPPPVGRLALLLCVLVAPGCTGRDRTAARAPSDLDLDSRGRQRTRAPPSGRPAPTKRQPAPAPIRTHGQRIDVDFAGARVDNALRLLAEVGGINLVIADDVTGTVTLRLRRVPWSDAFEAIVALEKLRLTRRHGIWMVSRRP